MTSISTPHALAALGYQRPIRAIESRPSPYRSSCALDEVDVWFDDGSTMALMAKAVDWDTMTPEAQRAKARWLCDERREQTVYECLLETADLATLRYFGFYVSGTGTRYLLLERSTGIPLWQSDGFDPWCDAARWLARLHSRVAVETVSRSAAAGHVATYDRRFYETWMWRAREFHAARAPAIERLIEPYRKVVDWLVQERPVFLHGEFYPSNVLIETTADGRALVRPVDWEMAALGPASIDLACLLAGRWTDAERADAADAYYAELAATGVTVPARERYLRALDYGLIHLSVRNLGWSAHWEPPADRLHDWLGEAFRLSEKWDL